LDTVYNFRDPTGMLVSFSGNICPPPSIVGGKAYSLIKLTELGFAVPSGAVLTTRFFAAWFKQVTDTPTWQALLLAKNEQRDALCQKMQSLCFDVSFDTQQQDALMRLGTLRRSWVGSRVAVRSSSPEEDLQSTSFAGGYDSVINAADLELRAAIKQCFASCFGARLLGYKKQQGFHLSSPTIAVIVQQQINSDTSGVCFSVNPLTNDYDEALIEANWGLGETTVSGLASPDQMVVNKHSGAITEKKLGGKQLSKWITPKGDIENRLAFRAGEYCLNTRQINELIAVVSRAEVAFARALDIEWAYTQDHLYILQARPITTLVPLPNEILSAPGQHRNLYIDVALAKGLTMNAPISPLGLDFVQNTLSRIFKQFVGPVSFSSDRNTGLFFFVGGRMYFNLSNVMVLINPNKIAKKIAGNDVMLAKILANVDKKEYRPPGNSLFARIRLLCFLPRIIWASRYITLQFLKILLSPERQRQAVNKKIAAFQSEASDHINYTLSLDDFQKRYTDLAVKHLINDTLVPVVVSIAAMDWLGLVVGKNNSTNRHLAEQLKKGFEDNQVIKLNVAMYELAGQLTTKELEDVPCLVQRIQDRKMPNNFLLTWDSFIQEFGSRGPMEMDLATPRYGDHPQLLLSQVASMASGDGKFSPAEMSQQQIVKREQAYTTLMSNVGWLRRKILCRLYMLIKFYCGMRDTPKHQSMIVNYALRLRALQEGQALVNNNRLDSANHIFDFTFEEIKAATSDPCIDLRSLRVQRSQFINKLHRQVSTFPIAIDSRGRILRPKAEVEIPGQLRGQPLSPGVAMGQIKVLNTANEKSIATGDILVAYTTDPGWTPLFVNAAAIVLEIGGVLQHGALVAREYGKPCIAGINDVVNRLEDGQTVEVNGDTGVIKIIS